MGTKLASANILDLSFFLPFKHDRSVRSSCGKVRFVTERLVLRMTARTPHVSLSFFEGYFHWLSLGYIGELVSSHDIVSVSMEEIDGAEYLGHDWPLLSKQEASLELRDFGSLGNRNHFLER